MPCLIGPRCKPMLMRLDLMVGQEVVLCDLVPRPTIVMILLIPLRPDMLISFLSDQKVHILTVVEHGRSPLLLTILLVGELTTVTLQIAKRQELQTNCIDGPPSVRIRLETLVQFYNAIDNGL
jgi:hypothetical protein